MSSSMKSICNDCRHVIKTDIEPTRIVKVNTPVCFWECRKSIIDPGGVQNSISGYVTEPTYRGCRKVNPDGNCDMFEAVPSLRSGLAGIVNALSAFFRRSS